MMVKQTASNLQEILNCPTVEKALGDVSRELAERRAFQPPVCSVFSHPYTVLEETDFYRFTVDKEA